MAPEALAGCSSTLASEVPRMLSHTKPKLALLIACLTSSVRLLPKTIKFPLHLQVMLFVVCNVCVCIRQQTGSEYWQSCQCCAWQCSMYEHAKWLVHIPVMQQRAASHCTIVELICESQCTGHFVQRTRLDCRTWSRLRSLCQCSRLSHPTHLAGAELAARCLCQAER